MDTAFIPNCTQWPIYAGEYRLDDPLYEDDDRVLVFAPSWEASEDIGVPVDQDAFATRFGLFVFQHHPALARTELWLADEYHFSGLREPCSRKHRTH